MNQNDFLKTRAILEEGLTSALHLGAQLYISRKGAVLADCAIGEVFSGIPMRRETILLWLSSGKPVTAVAIAQLQEQGELDWNDRVTRFIPEFGNHGKDTLTLRHLLTHTAGFRDADKISTTLPWEEKLDRICQTPMEEGWVPGEMAGYQTWSSWLVLAEVIQRVTRNAYPEWVRQRVFAPLDLRDSWIGMPPDQFAIYQEQDRLGALHNRTGDVLTINPAFSDETAFMVCRPGGGACGPIRELGKFSEFLLGFPLPNSTVLNPETIRTLTTRHRKGLTDHTFLHIMDWGLGFILNSNRYGAETVPYGYGRHASEETFGHSGAQSSSAFADPAHSLVVAWVCNGMPGEWRHQKRARAINSAIYEDLGLAEN